MPEIRCLCVPSPAADGDTDGAGSFGSKLKAAGRRHGEPGDLGDDGAEPAMAQPFLKTRQNRLLVSRLDINHPIGSQPSLGNGWGEEVLPCDAPENLAAGPGGNSRAANSAAAAPSIAPFPPPATSCSAPSAKPPSGRCRSIALMPKGSTVRRRPAAPSRR